MPKKGYILLRKYVIGWLKLLLSIREISGSNLDPENIGYILRIFVTFLSPFR
jgi:hypothetical protein